jgi:hypothetical protein
MPKKSTPARGGVQRTKAKQKGFELVRPASAAQEEGVDTNTEQTAVGVSTATATVPVRASRQTETPEKKERPSSATQRSQAPLADKTDDATSEEETDSPEEQEIRAPKGSAAARLAARRQAGQRTQRTATALITAEHYGYVRKDLIFIAILAIIMFGTIIVLHFVPGIGS